MKQQNVNPAQQTRHLRDYWQVIWNGRWTVLSIFTVVVVMGSVATFLQAPMYEATAALELNARPRSVVPGREVAQLGAAEYGYLAAERYFNTQYEVLRSRAVVGKVMKQLNLYEDPVFANASDPEEAFLRRIIIEPVAQTGIARVSMRAGDPAVAALWVNTLAEVYVQRNLDQAIASTEAAVNSLIQRLVPLKEELRANERARLEFAGENALYVAGDPQSVLQESLKFLQRDLVETRVKLVETGALMSKISEIGGKGGDYRVLSVISNDPTIQSLMEDRNELERELRKLQVTYKSGHFKVQEKEAEQEKVDRRIESEVERLVASTETEYALLLEHFNEVENSIQQTQEQSITLGRRASEYEVLSGESGDSRKLYDLIASRIKAVDLDAKLLRNNVSILDAAIVPESPVSPKKRLNIALSIVLGMLLGVGTVFSLDYLDNTVKSSQDVEDYLGLSILAIVPRKRDQFSRVITESFQNLRTNVNFSSLNRTRRVILVTSAGPQEGKTSTVVTLAQTQAAAGDRVILIDCDLRRPNVHHHLKLKRNGGLTNFLSEETDEGSWRKYLKPVGPANLDILTCGPIPPNPAELFGTDRFRNLLRQLKEEYDWVLIDSPPVSSLSDGLILASVADMVAFVIRHRENDRELIRRAVENVRGVTEHVIGAVLNDVDVGRSHYRDYYYSGYYYYGSEENDDSKSVRKKFKGRKVG